MGVDDRAGQKSTLSCLSPRRPSKGRPVLAAMQSIRNALQFCDDLKRIQHPLHLTRALENHSSLRYLLVLLGLDLGGLGGGGRGRVVGRGLGRKERRGSLERSLEVTGGGAAEDVDAEDLARASVSDEGRAGARDGCRDAPWSRREP